MRENRGLEFSSNNVLCGCLYLSTFLQLWFVKLVFVLLVTLVFSLIMLHSKRLNVALDFTSVFF